MSRIGLLSILGAVAVLGAGAMSTSSAALAQKRSSPVRPPSGGLPTGSYQQSCRGINLNGNMLSAQCTNNQGAPVFSSIDTNGCRGRDIANDNGYLRCEGGNGPRPPVPPTPQIPAGSYQQSCRGITLSGNTLRAQCTNTQGRPVSSSLNLSNCRGQDISNDNGYLRCGATGPRPPVPPTPQIPTGSYQQSCRGITLSGNTLRAQCTNTQGRPVSSSLDLNSCRGQDIINDNGYLRCASNGPRPPVPPIGGGSFEAILYTSANFRGQSLTVREPIANLGNFRGFNDNVRSIRIVRGQTEVCTDARYRGRCVQIDRSVADLNQFRLANQISSIR